MAEGIATRSSRGHRTICVPIEEEDYLRIIHDPKAFRRTLDDCFRQTPELFPVNFALGYELKDDRMSAKQQIPIRRILLKDDSAYSIRPSFLMPYMTARTADVEGPLFLRKFGVPFWALARVFGGDPMSWYRMECGLGRFSVVGTTVRTATLPEHLLADEHHQGLDGQKVYIATTVGNGCCLGAEPAEAAGSDKLKVAYQVFKDEACDVSPKYAPKTVSTDGWRGRKRPGRCCLRRSSSCCASCTAGSRSAPPNTLKRCLPKSPGGWDTYHAPDRRSFAQRLRSLRQCGRTPHRDRPGEGLARLSSLCSFRTLYFTPESGPATEGFSCRGAVMNDEGNAARKIRKLRASRDLWKQRSAEKQQEIRQLRVTVRDLSSSRENWKTRVKELEQQLQAAHEAHAAVGPGSWIFFGGLMDNQAMPRTRRTPITLSSD